MNNKLTIFQIGLNHLLKTRPRLWRPLKIEETQYKDPYQGLQN